MKAKMTLLLVSVLLLTGCDWFKGLDDVTFSTDLTMNIPVVVTGEKSVSLTKEEIAVAFSSSEVLDLADNADIEPYLDKIKEIDLKSLVVTVTGLGAGQTINTISLSVSGVGIICTQTNITSANNSFTPAVDESLLNQAAAKLRNDKKITVTVSGDVNGPMVFSVGLVFDTEITANALE